MTNVKRYQTEVPHVAIIGAGISGLRCADVLLQSGFSVTIFEARNRIGGRVHQVQIKGGYTVDLGPNWIHANGSENPISTLAKRTNTALYQWPRNSEITIDSDGRRIPAPLARHYSREGWRLIGKAYKYSAAHCKDIDPDMNVKIFLEEEIAKKQISSKEAVEILRVAEHMGAYPGEDIEKLSLKYFYFEDGEENDDVFVASTYRNVLQEIARNAVTNATINMSCEVSRIESLPNLQGCTSVKIHTKSGQEDEFDAVIMTAPLGWLKKNPFAFEPQLPLRIRSALESLSFGRLEKCYITFKSPWWQEASDEQKEQKRETSDYKDDNDDDDDDRKGDDKNAECEIPGDVSFHSPNYANHPTNSLWPLECVCLSSLPPSTAHPTLLFYVFGDCGATMVSEIAEISPISPEYHDKLARFFFPFYSKLPNYDATSPNCVPSGILATTWQTDPVAGYGSYTNVQVGSENAERAFEVLSEGMPEQGIWFAGEHAAGKRSLQLRPGHT